MVDKTSGPSSGWRKWAAQQAKALGGRAVRAGTDGVEAARGWGAQIDWEKVAERSVQLGESSARTAVRVARGILERYGPGTTATLQDAARSSGRFVETSAAMLIDRIKSTDPKAVVADLRNLVEQIRQQEGPIAAWRFLQNLSTNLRGAITSGEEHDRVASRQPAYQRAEETDARATEAVRELSDAVASELAVVQQHRKFSPHALAADAAVRIRNMASDIFRGLAGSHDPREIQAKLGEFNRKVLEWFERNVPSELKPAFKSFGNIVDEVTTGAMDVLVKLRTVDSVQNDRDQLFGLFMETLETIRFGLDDRAHTFAIGFVDEGNLGATGAEGREMVFNPHDKRLELWALKEIGLRPGVGWSIRPYGSSIYDAPNPDARESRRSVVEGGFVCFHGGAGWSPPNEEGQRTRSWNCTMGLGGNVVPFLSDWSLRSVAGERIATHQLTDDQVSAALNLLQQDDASRIRAYWAPIARSALGVAIDGVEPKPLTAEAYRLLHQLGEDIRKKLQKEPTAIK